MAKFYIKTTIYTILCIALISILSFLTLSLFFPKTLSNVLFNVESKDLCVKYSEKQYNNTKNIQDLDTLLYRCVWANNTKKSKLYANELLNHKDFESFSQKKGDGYINYVAGIYCNALYSSGEKEISVNTAIQYVDKDFKIPNPISSIAYLAYKDGDTLTLQLILEKLDNVEESQNVINAKTEIKNKINEINNS